MCCASCGGSSTGRLVIEVAHNDRTWRVDLTLWLNDPHADITAWHESLRDSVTAEQRRAILRIKDVWRDRGHGS